MTKSKTSVRHRQRFDPDRTWAQYGPAWRGCLGLQMHVHSLQHQTPQIVLLQQMAEAADGGLVRRRCRPEIHANESPKRRRLVQRLFHTGILQIEPLLHKLRPQHDPQPHPTAPDPRIEPFKEFDHHVTYGHQESHKYGVALSWFLHFSMTALAI
jgi:hypothetical protein